MAWARIKGDTCVSVTRACGCPGDTSPAPGYGDLLTLFSGAAAGAVIIFAFLVIAFR